MVMFLFYNQKRMLIYPHRLELILGECLEITRFVNAVKAKCMVGASPE